MRRTRKEAMMSFGEYQYHEGYEEGFTDGCRYILNGGKIPCCMCRHRMCVRDHTGLYCMLHKRYTDKHDTCKESELR